jgi:hypothetical protein
MVDLNFTVSSTATSMYQSALIIKFWPTCYSMNYINMMSCRGS